MSLSLDNFSNIFRERKGNLQNLPSVDYLVKLTNELTDVGQKLIPKIGERTRTSDTKFTASNLEIVFFRPSLGPENDLNWRIKANEKRIAIEVATGSYARDVLVYAILRIQTEFASFVGHLDASSRLSPNFSCKVNKALLPIDQLVKALNEDDNPQLAGSPFEILFEVETLINVSPEQELLKWLESSIGLLAPVYRFLALPLESSLTTLEDENANVYPEGRINYAIHKERERNQTLVKEVKKISREQNGGRLICQTCGFDFYEFYGERGRDYAEAHHILPVSQMEANHETRIEDMIIVCSNCHRMLHRSPLISPDKLSKMLDQRR